MSERTGVAAAPSRLLLFHGVFICPHRCCCQHVFSFQSSRYQEQLPPDGKTNLEDMERLFLQFSFNMPPAAVGGALEKEPPLSSGGQFAVAPDLRNKLEELLLLVAENLLVFYVPDVSRCFPLPVCVCV